MKVRFEISTDKIGSKCTDVIEFDDDEWAEMTPEDREEAMREIAFQHIEWNWEEA